MSKGPVIIQGSGNASATALAVIIGPIAVDCGECDVSLVSFTIAGTVTTPTNPKLQYCPEASGAVWVDVPSGAVTVSSSSSTATEKTVLNIVCKFIRVVAAGAFAAGNSTIYLHGIEKSF